MSKFLQYELHKECNNGCGFCFNKNQPKLNKFERIRMVHHDVFNGSTDEYTDLGFIGGELFDPSLYVKDERNALIELWHTACRQVKHGKLKRLLITSALMMDDCSLLFEVLKIAEHYQVIDKVLLCTSWDKMYRFSDRTLKLWQSTMRALHELHPSLMLHVEMIMTGCLVDYILEAPNFVSNFEKEYNCTVDFIQPSVGYYYKTKEEFEKVMPNFFPQRAKFFDAVHVLYKDGVNLDGLLDMRKHADTVDCYFNGHKIVFEDRHVKEKYVSCMLEQPQVGYCDSDVPMRKDVENILHELE